MKWSEDQTYQFVKLYLAQGCLWNPKHPEYKSKTARWNAYHRLITEFRDVGKMVLTESEVNVKIRVLRSTYCQELTKIMKRSTPDCPFRSSMKWFADWHKCFKYFTRKKINESDTFEFQELDPIDESCQKTLSDDYGNDSENEATESDPFTKDSDFVLVVKPEPDENNKLDLHKEILYKIKKRKSENTSVDYSHSTYRSSTDSNSDMVTREDEFDIYGKYIASQLRKMNLQKALRLQLEIQSLVSEARIADLSDQ